MNWIQDAVAEYGRQLGIEGLRLDANGAVQLQLQSGGLLAVEQTRRGEIDEVLVYLGSPLGFEGPRRLRAALARAHYSNGTGQAVQVACRGEGPEALLLVIVRLPERDFTLQSLGQAFDFLSRWLENLPAR